MINLVYICRKIKYKIPKLVVEFVNHKDITDKFAKSIVGMKKHFNNWDREYAVKGKTIDNKLELSWAKLN